MVVLRQLRLCMFPPPPTINSAHDGAYTEADLSSDIVTLSPAAVAATVGPLDKGQKRFAFILQFYTPL